MFRFTNNSVIAPDRQTAMQLARFALSSGRLAQVQGSKVFIDGTTPDSLRTFVRLFLSWGITS